MVLPLGLDPLCGPGKAAGTVFLPVKGRVNCPALMTLGLALLTFAGVKGLGVERRHYSLTLDSRTVLEPALFALTQWSQFTCTPATKVSFTVLSR